MSAHSARPLLIGLTGPIGCGKSTVAGWLAARGATIVDADRLARSVTEPGSAALAAVVERFGRGVIRADGSLDRAALGRIVFGDPAALADLEAIVHPAVRPRILAALQAAATAEPPPVAVVLEAIKLVEAGYPALLDEVWLVTCEPDEQHERLIERGLSAADAAQRMTAQAGLMQRVAGAATRIVDTTGSPVAAERQVATALALALAERRSRRPDLD